MYSLRLWTALDRIVPRHHDQIGWVEIDRHAGGMQGVQEGLENGRQLGSGLDGEMGPQAVGVGRQLAAGVLHDPEGVAIGIRGHHANMGGHHVGLQILGQIQNALGSLDKLRVLLRVGKALAQIAAQRGDGQPPGLAHVKELPPFLRG